MMTQPPTVMFYLEDGFRQSAEAGQHNFINQVVTVLVEAGMAVQFAPLEDREKPHAGYSLSHMAQPPNERGLVFRRVYHYPFWQIDAVAQRWHWDVARAPFDPDLAVKDAQRFYRFWQKRLFGEAALAPDRQGYVYVPLQGKLDQHRPFQSCSPLEMIEHCLRHETSRQIIATLHPKERYSVAERAKLRALEAKHARLVIDTGNMEKYLHACDYIVTQNSGVAFSGYFFGKPVLLFGKVDFHHIAVRAEMQALGENFDEVREVSPDYATYVWWFWQDQSINAGRDDANSKIAARLKRFGWPVG